jgi:hypothetical protein
MQPEIVLDRSAPDVPLLAAVGAIAAVLLGLAVTTPSGTRLGLCAAASLLLATIGIRAPRLALAGVVGWLVALGMLRRLVSLASPIRDWGDPLLLVAPPLLIGLAVIAIRRGALREPSVLSRAVLLVGAVLAASTVNPAQGGLATGLAGALFGVVPIAAFAVGRVLVDDRLLHRLFQFVSILGLVVAAYGLWQTFIGFPAWDATWIADRGYAALNVGGVIRPFSSFSSASEYAMFLALGLMVTLAGAGWTRRPLLVSGATVLLGSALWLVSARGIVVGVVATLGLLLSARLRLSFVQASAVVIALLVSVGVVVGWLGADQAVQAGNPLVQHQIEGLADPFGEDSTGPGHLIRVADGVVGVFHEPLGVGVGAVSIASRLGGVDAGTEMDLGNAAVAAGLPGLIGYLAVAGLGLYGALGLARSRLEPLSRAALGVLGVTFMQWLNGGQYAVVIWPWLVLGWIDATRTRVTLMEAGPVLDEAIA